MKEEWAAFTGNPWKRSKVSGCTLWHFLIVCPQDDVPVIHCFHFYVRYSAVRTYVGNAVEHSEINQQWEEGPTFDSVSLYTDMDQETFYLFLLSLFSPILNPPTTPFAISHVHPAPQSQHVIWGRLNHTERLRRCREGVEAWGFVCAWGVGLLGTIAVRAPQAISAGPQDTAVL